LSFSVFTTVEQHLQDVAEHHGDVADGHVVVPVAGGEIDRAVDGAADVGAGGEDAVAQTGGSPAGPDPWKQAEAGFVLGE
jgi:hypothetical protein